MKFLQFEIGDDVWAHGIDSGTSLSKGKVVHKFKLDDWAFEHYVVEFPCHIDPILKVRCGTTLSDAEDKPIGFWRK